MGDGVGAHDIDRERVAVVACRKRVLQRGERGAVVARAWRRIDEHRNDRHRSSTVP
jgi:hypothetical protein